MSTVKRIVFAITCALGLGASPDKELNCPHCQSTQVSKKNHWLGQAKYLCQNCDRYFVESEAVKQFNNAVQEHCLNLYASGMNVGEIERVTGVERKLINNWVELAASKIAQSDEFQNFIRARKARTSFRRSSRRNLRLL